MFKTLYQIFRMIREFVLSLFFVVFVMICFVFTSLFTSSNHTPPIKSGFLTLRLNGYLADNPEEYGDLYRLLNSELNHQQEPQKYSTFDIALAIEQAANDSRIEGIVLDLGKLQDADYPALTYLGNKLKNFRKENKPIVAVGVLYSQAQYYLASFANKIYLNQAGAVDIHGLSYTPLYFKSLFDKIEAKPEIFRVGTYKSAVEPLIRDNMSPEAKGNASLWLSAMWSQVSETISENRQIAKEAVLPDLPILLKRYQEVSGNDAQYALKQGLVNQLFSGEEALKRQLRDDFKLPEKHEPNFIELEDYLTEIPDRFEETHENKIAVVTVEGEITMGESTEDTAGSETIVKTLQRVKEDKYVKGLILRINSPGGSAVASELIRQAVNEVQASGKPVVASMGGMAASGGYWIAATSDKIVADANTLTGSIGIFGVMFNFEQTAKNLGIREDGIATSKLANISGLKPLSEEQRRLIQLNIENGYQQFLRLVSQGRGMTEEDVDYIAQGQVWIGKDAYQSGLVDELGDFDFAVNLLHQMIISRNEENAPKKVQWFTAEDNSFFGELSRNMKQNAQYQLASLFDLPVAKQAKQATDVMKKFNDPKNSYLYCLACAKVR